ncbi:hypothetical protein DXG01_008723 [Tephrocybe rancida]|nr:hypothetical protein DXG01_008723 [Tephrocybe rancida]
MGNSDEVVKLLARLRDIPLNTEQMSEKELTVIYTYLIEVPKSSIGVLHWFCSRADPDVVETAKFCIRMFAYDSVEPWRQKLRECIGRCPECVQGLERAKVTTRTTYFGAYEAHTLNAFFQTMESWELVTVIDDLTKAGLLGSRQLGQKTLADVDSAVAYRMMSNWTVFKDPRIQSVINDRPPPEPLPRWPKDPLPPGMLILLMHDKADVRRWAEAHASQCTAVPMPEDDFIGVYLDVVEIIGRHLTDQALDINLSLSFATKPSDLWAGFRIALRQLPVNALGSTSRQYSDFRGIIARHLYDTGALDVAVYRDILAKMVDFLCEEAQHERFKEARPLIMLSGIRLLSSVLRKCRSEEGFPHRKALHGALDIHGETFLSVAFARSYDTENWQLTRSTARALISEVLETDVADVTTTIHNVTDSLAQNLRPGEVVKTAKFRSLAIRNSAWKKLYTTVQTTDAEGIAMLIELVAQSCHIDTLNIDHFSHISSHLSIDGSQPAKAALIEVNRALGVFRDGFLSAMTGFADYNTSSAALDLLRRPGVVKNLMMISISPNEDLQVAAQVLVGLAFDVDARIECLRALLENRPGEAFEGILEFLTTFKRYAPVMPEACNLSKSLVRCFTDILEVLSATPNGLLHSTHFLNPSNDKGPAANLINMWKLMTKSFVVILKRTPSWATYFESQEMVVWMRDALIFGRDMLATWRAIEHAANSREPAAIRDSGKLSSIGKQMATGLQEVLFELTRWLRLTDEELLHQSFALLTSLLACFRDSGMSPTDVTTARLRKFIDSARQNRADPSQANSRLDPTRLLTLEAALDDFEDVVEIVSPPALRVVPKAKAPVVATKEKTKEQRYIMTTSSSKSKPVPSLTARSSSTSMKSQYFKEKERDQQKIDADLSAPTFRRPSTTIVPAKPLAGPSRSSTSGPKFEGHAPAAQSESSSSESASDSDDDGQPNGLARLAKLQRSPKIKKPVERRRIMTMDIPVQRNAVQDRLARKDEIRNAKIRLNPDIGELYKAVLSWDYQHAGPYPPGHRAEYATIPNQFATYDDYRKTWEPLLLLDIWAQVAASKQEDQDTFDVKVNSRQFSDQWLEIDISFTGSIKKDWYLSDTDLILLKHQNSQKLIMAKTTSYKSTPFGSQQGTQAVVRCLAKNDPGLQMNTIWKLSKVINLTTVQREYASLVAVPYYDHFNTILNPRLPNHSELKDKDVREIMSSYRVNEPQAKAILSSLRSDGFVLIQGPPGTGKTSTICSLIAASLSAKKPQIVFAGRGGPTTKAPTKILLCAPSNAAIDEIAARIHSGNFGGKPPGSIKVVRLGKKQTMSNSVQDIGLDYLVELKLATDAASSGKPVDTSAEVASLQHEIEALKLLKTQKEQEKENTHDNGARRQALMDEISQFRSRQIGLVRELNRRRDQNKSKMRDQDAKRRTFMLDVLQESDVICTTLSGAANDLLSRFEFEMVIVDEAAQCVELSSLIPLKYRSNRCIMVGDPQQLPPTVISKEVVPIASTASKTKARCSPSIEVFALLLAYHEVSLHLPASIQYRMHPEISCLPSRIFYKGKLLDGPEMDIKTKQPWHSNPKFGTYRFFNVANGIEESDGRRSLKNMGECRVAVALYARLVQQYASIDFSYRVGIVSMYRAQIGELRKAFEARFGQKVLDSVDFNTVDGFQGQEKDIIILSCVRSGLGLQAIGFLDDVRRMNVALTRAKSSLFILGNAPTLERSDENWRSIITDARTRSSLVNVSLSATLLDTGANCGQTDPSFFTTSAAVHTVPPPPTPMKPSRSVVPPAPLPSDLVTPQNFKSLQQAGSKNQQSNSAVPHPSINSTMSSKDLPPPNTPEETPKTERFEEPSSSNLKRPAESSESSSARPSNGGNSKPRPPPAKRQKQSSIFIPKPNKKRPSDDTISGPPNTRRRV